MLPFNAPFIDQPETAPIIVAGQYCHPHHLLVRTADRKVVLEIAGKGARIETSYPEIGYLVVNLPRSRVAFVKNMLSKVFGAQKVSLDGLKKIAYSPNDPLYVNQWHTRALKVDLAWNVSLGSSLPVVAIIDTGVDYNHLDLKANIWTNPNEVPTNGLDNDHNGYINDWHGWDFVGNTNDPMDRQGHGTACAGLAAAVGDNNIGMSGVAPRARIMCLRAGDSSGYFYDTATIPAYFYAAKNGANVMSMSYFTDRVTLPERLALDYCWNHNVLPIAAAANDATVYSYYPAAYEHVLAVGALDMNLHKAGFSDYGSWVDVASPGVGLIATTWGGGYTNGFGGTSGATPQVAGLAALLMGFKPSLTAAQTRRIIEDSSTIVSEDPFGEYTNYGIVNAEVAMELAYRGARLKKPYVTRWMSPLGKSTNGSMTTTRLYGRGFSDNELTVTDQNNRQLGAARERDYVDVTYNPSTTTAFRVLKSSKYLIATIPVSATAPFFYPMIEADTHGGWITGGYQQSLWDDNDFIVAPQSNGTIQMNGTFRMVTTRPGAALVLKHRYQGLGTTVGTETVEVYDWASASYPYGGWIVLSSGPIGSSWSTQRLPIPDLGRIADGEGTAYFRIQTTSGLANTAELDVDLCRIEAP